MESIYWPELPYTEWLDTYETLHLYTQIAGKIKLALAPWLAEWWHVALAIWARGITTGPLPFGSRLLEIRFDFISHIVEVMDSTGNSDGIELAPRPVAEFYQRLMSSLNAMGIEIDLSPAPQEMVNKIPLDTDMLHRSYDRNAVGRFWVVLSGVAGIFEKFRSGFAGKSSPVQFYWGSFDLALSRYCGNPCSAPPHSGRMARVGDDEEHFAAGFWPGDNRLPEPAFYAYRYPALPGLEKAPLRPQGAYWNDTLGEFILPYNNVRIFPSPDEAILEFLTSSYETVATLGNWNRTFLERKIR